MYTLGIDLGTTFTAAATWREHHAEIASLGGRSAVIPSVVLLREDGTFVTGEAASRRAVTEPHRVAREFKRRLGDTTPILLGGSPYSAEALMARLLRAVVDEVSAREGGPPARICICHPANWGQYKLDLLQQAVRLSDLRQPVSYTTEPQAAAVFYAQQRRIEAGAVVAVYDLGGGTFDAAVLRKTATGFELLGQPEGIERLGGIDFDAAVFNHVTKALGTKLAELDEDDPTVISAVARLREECTQAKEALSADTDATIPVLLPNVTTEVRITRAELEGMVRPALHDTIGALRRALQSAGVADDLHSVLLVGGSSRMPIVAQMVGAELGRPVAVDAHPKHAVALGAAWIASGASAEPPAPEKVKGRATAPVSPAPRSGSPAMPPMPVPPTVKPAVPAPVSPAAATVIAASPLVPPVPAAPTFASGSATVSPRTPRRAPEAAPTIAMRADAYRPAPPTQRPRQQAPAWTTEPPERRGRGKGPVLAGIAVGLVIALSVTGYVLVQNLGKGGGPGGTVDRGAISTAEVTTPPTSDTPPTSEAVTSSAPPPVTYPNSPAGYANAAVKAWRNGDAVRLGQLNDPGSAIFNDLNAGNYNKIFTLYKCNYEAGLDQCQLYNKVGDVLILRMRHDLIGQAQAIVNGDFNQITFPLDLQQYAQQALDAWQARNTNRVALLTTDPAENAIRALPDSLRTKEWTFDHADGAAGTLTYHWRTVANETLIFAFDNPDVVPPPANRHNLIKNVIFQPPA